MEVKKTTKKRRRHASRKKKLLSPSSLRVLQDIADLDWQLIESSTQRTISELNDVEKLEENLEEKLDETSATARTDTLITALPHAADSKSQDRSEQNAQKATRRLPLVRKRTHRRSRRFKLSLFDDSGEEKLNETSATTQTDAFRTALPHVADSNSKDKSGQNARKTTRELIQRKGTQLPTIGRGASSSFFLGSYVEKAKDYSNEVLIYLASVAVSYHTGF